MSYHDVVDFVVHVCEAREAAETRCCLPLALPLGLKKCRFGRMHEAFALTLTSLDLSMLFGPTTTDPFSVCVSDAGLVECETLKSLATLSISPSGHCLHNSSFSLSTASVAPPPIHSSLYSILLNILFVCVCVCVLFCLCYAD